MATKQIKKLSDLQKITTATGDQMIPVVDASGNVNPIKLTDLAQVVAELMSSSKLYPFMNRGLFNDESMIYDLNTFTQSGTYLISATQVDNAPESIAGNMYLTVLDFTYSSNTRTVQILCIQNNFYFRTLGPSNWANWMKL